MSRRTHSKSRIPKKTPKGRNVVHYVDKSPQIAKCAKCKGPILGLSRKMKKAAKSQKNINRPYGGYLCSKCYNRIESLLNGK